MRISIERACHFDLLTRVLAIPLKLVSNSVQGLWWGFTNVWDFVCCRAYVILQTFRRPLQLTLFVLIYKNNVSILSLLQ